MPQIPLSIRYHRHHFYIKANLNCISWILLTQLIFVTALTYFFSSQHTFFDRQRERDCFEEEEKIRLNKVNSAKLRGVPWLDTSCVLKITNMRYVFCHLICRFPLISGLQLFNMCEVLFRCQILKTLKDCL